ncbi:transglutaminase superfamily protein [Flavobacterium sp. 270]|uniref:DUF3857 domain-containing protein n=1 Tax=Flavobacterium sp. 270 TaxID=2512114 RepID=UPI00106658EB|nr:DUF3857 domain-containing protein [Flavobacterium sp. 270]TDW45839.1 transglutaminase superfamily protein [Flavobacterium sp. 270]
MIPRFILFSFLFISTISKINAQNYQLENVTKEELLEKSNPKDTTAPAAILFKKAKTYFTYSDRGFLATNVYELKIKIYKKEGLSWANQKVSYYVGYENLNDDSVKFSDAVTYNLENGAIVKTKLNSEGSFKNKINKYWNESTITLPNVKVGSIIEFKYVLKTENIIRLPDFDFQFDIPVNYFEYKTEIPEFFIYKTVNIGFNKIETQTELVQNKQLYASDYKQINSTYTGYNIPALTKEKYIDNINNYLGSIHKELEKKRFPDKPVVDYTKTWEGVATTIYKSESFGKEIKVKDYFTEDLKSLIQNLNTPREKLNAIFNFVQKRMNWDERRGYNVDKGVKKAYTDRTGNVAEINFMLLSMLKTAGIEANPVLVSTLENGIPLFPTLTDFNYVIASAEIDGEQILLDASNKFTTPNILPLNVLNWNGRLIKEDGTSKEIPLIRNEASKNFYNIIAEIDPKSGKVEGTLNIRKTGYNALKFRAANDNKKNEEYLEKLENDFNIEVKEYSIENKNEDLSKAVSEKIEFTLNHPYDVIDSKIIMRPLLFFTDKNNPFNQENRIMPVYFGFVNHHNYTISYEIPAGYAVESLPKSKRIALENKQAVFTLVTAIEDNKIQIRSTTEINKAIFAADEYDMLKEFFQKIIESQNEKIVLKKI